MDSYRKPARDEEDVTDLMTAPEHDSEERQVSPPHGSP